MKYSFLSGLLWGIDTVLLAVLTTLFTLAGSNAHENSISLVILTGIIGALLHDIICAIFMWIYISTRKKLHKTFEILKNPKIFIIIIVSSLLGGPLGMSGYVLASNTIGAGYAAAISALYPAFGAVLSAVVLRERLSAKKYIAFSLALIAVGILGYYSCNDAQNTVSSTNILNVLLGLSGAFLSVIGWGSEAVVCAWATRKQSIDDETILHIRETTSAISYTIIASILCFASHIEISKVFESLNLTTLPIIIAIGLLGTGSYLSYYRGIAQVGASRAMAANVTYAVWAMVAASLIYQTMPSIIAWICCFTIMCTTIFVARQ
ncbi:DMT family transporter [Gardnerella sp. DNF00502]|uniref:DMT family transporter n=1 Tax=unclassified Gardnerella TaxID=2628112 RepID=UPI000C9F1D73|nr:DMT family transporter [Gardnerella sp. KA00735]PNP89500.1 EamA family transporter [Gardnerella sp. KA00735]